MRLRQPGLPSENRPRDTGRKEKEKVDPQERQDSRISPIVDVFFNRVIQGE